MLRKLLKNTMRLLFVQLVWLACLPWLLLRAGWLESDPEVAGFARVTALYGQLHDRISEPFLLFLAFVPVLPVVLYSWRRRGRSTRVVTLDDAVRYGMYENVLQMIENGEDLNKPTATGLSALQTAVQQGDVRMAGLLLENGADFDVTDIASGMTPLHTAAQQGSAALVELLVRYGADINATDAEHNTPLHRAVRSGDAASVQVLLKYNPDSGILNAEGLSASALAEQLALPELTGMIQVHFTRQWAYLRMNSR